MKLDNNLCHYVRYAIDMLIPWEARANSHKIHVFDYDLGICDVTTSINPITMKGGTKHRVRLCDESCVCNKWKTYGIPCSHAIAACKEIGVDYLRFVKPYYKLPTYLACYVPQFEPIPDQSCWPEPSGQKVVPDVSYVRGVGRPRSSRIRNEMDWREPAVKIRCGVCRQEGHNRRNCPHRASRRMQ